MVEPDLLQTLLERIAEAEQIEQRHAQERRVLHDAIKVSASSLSDNVVQLLQTLKATWCGPSCSSCTFNTPLNNPRPPSHTREKQRQGLQQEACAARDSVQQELQAARTQLETLQQEKSALQRDVAAALNYRAAYKAEHDKHQRTKQRLEQALSGAADPDTLAAVQQHATLLQDELHRCQEQCKVMWVGCVFSGRCHHAHLSSAVYHQQHSTIGTDARGPAAHLP